MRIALIVVLSVVSALAQNKPNRPQPHKPTLGFNKAKDIAPIIDADAVHEQYQMKKRLPGNQFVGDKEALHEAVLSHDFLDGFRSAKECDGIVFYMKNTAVPDYALQVTVNFHDTPRAEQEWIWMLLDQKNGKLGGLGTQSSAKLTARDVCMTVWEDVDPNHYKKPGGKIE